MEEYNGVYPFAIAAYNAGPNRVKTCEELMEILQKANYHM